MPSEPSTVGRLMIVSGSDPKPISSNRMATSLVRPVETVVTVFSNASHVLVIGAKMVARRLLSRRALGSACAPVQIAIPMYMLGLI